MISTTIVVVRCKMAGHFCIILCTVLWSKSLNMTAPYVVDRAMMKVRVICIEYADYVLLVLSQVHSHEMFKLK